MRWWPCLLAVLVCLTTAPGGAAAQTCRYEIVPSAGDDLRELVLDVAISCDVSLAPADFDLGYGGGRFAEWRADGLGYRIRIGALADARSRQDFTSNPMGVLSPIDAWLAAPNFKSGVDELGIVEPAGDIRMLSNLSSGAGGLRLTREDWIFGGYTVFTRKSPLVVHAPGPAAFDRPGRDGPVRSEIQIAVLDDGFRMTDVDIAHWIESFAGYVARFWAGFPTDSLLVSISPGGRLRDPFGRVRGGGGATVSLRLSTEETPAFLHERDWVLTHELIHLAAPFTRGQPPWLMEGMATYLEPIILALAGVRTRDAVWAEWLRAMPGGALGIATEGLSGRGGAYWTGALALLLTHKEIAEGGSADGLVRCFRAIRRHLGDASARAPRELLIRVCDRALGQPFLANVANRLDDPTIIDMPTLWRSLGVSGDAAGIAYSETGAATRARMLDPRQLPRPLR